MFGPIGGFDDAGNRAGVPDIDWHCLIARPPGRQGDRPPRYLCRRIRNNCAGPIS